MDAKLEIIKYNEHDIRKWVTIDGFVCYETLSVSKACGTRGYRATMENFSSDDIVDIETRKKYNIQTMRRYKNTYRKDDTMILLTERGLKRLLCVTRSIAAIDFAKFMNIDVYSYKYFVKEPEFINAIIQAFPGEEHQLQYTPDNTNYRIDLYFPKYNLAVECDENHHKNNQVNDIERQKEITEILKCNWIRFCPDDANFNIFKTIGEIYSIIKS